MADELGFHGNELVQFQTIFVVGNVVGLLPFIHLFPRVPMHVLVPTLDLGWGLFTLLQYRAQSYAEIMAYRFMVAIFEVSPSLLPHPSWIEADVQNRPRTSRAFTLSSVHGIEVTKSAEEEASSTSVSPSVP